MDPFVQPAAVAESVVASNYGQYNGQAKLSEAKVRDMLNLFAEDGKIPVEVDWKIIQDVAKEYGVNPRTIDLALMGETWRHVLPEIERRHDLIHVNTSQGRVLPRKSAVRAVVTPPVVQSQNQRMVEVPAPLLAILLDDWGYGLEVLKAVIQAEITPKTPAGWRSLFYAVSDSMGSGEVADAAADSVAD